MVDGLKDINPVSKWNFILGFIVSNGVYITKTISPTTVELTITLKVKLIECPLLKLIIIEPLTCLIGLE